MRKIPWKSIHIFGALSISKIFQGVNLDGLFLIMHTCLIYLGAALAHGYIIICKRYSTVDPYDAPVTQHQLYSSLQGQECILQFYTFFYTSYTLFRHANDKGPVRTWAPLATPSTGVTTRDSQPRNYEVAKSRRFTCGLVKRRCAHHGLLGYTGLGLFGDIKKSETHK